METVLITGVSGFLGWNLACRLKSQYRIYGTYLDHQVSLPGVETLAFDLSDLSKIPRLCETLRPSVIVHTAAFSNPDYCELHHKEALTLNTFATREFAKATSRLGSRLIYTSTDFVFNGEKGDYSEADDPAPINYYGKTKFLGELEIMNHSSHYASLRIGTLYGRGNGVRLNFFEKLERDALAGVKLPCIVDQYRTFLFVDDAVLAISHFVADKRLKGLFHLGGPERVNRYEFAERFCSIAGVSVEVLQKIRLDEAGFAAVRPRDCSLNSSKITKALNRTFTPLDAALRQLCTPERESRDENGLE
jgi:dTDP-4-dehydrorhamnose reductase